jgi:hypothetical protein
MQPSCPQGYTAGDLAAIFGDGLPAFYMWMRGQTQPICDGRSYNHARGCHERTDCAGSPHGAITYEWDVRRYIDNRDHGTPLVWD